MSIFDAHLHIINCRFPLVENQGFRPAEFTCTNYLERVAGLGVAGGAIVSGSFQAFDQSYLMAALAELGPSYVGVTQLPASTADETILELNQHGVRAVRFNLRRGGSAGLDDVDALARRVHELAGWHAEFYVDGRELSELHDLIAPLPRVVIDHLGLTREGLPTLYRLVEKGARVKATGFGRLDFDPAPVLKAISQLNPKALMFGSDLPGTRAQRPFELRDLELIRDALGNARANQALFTNAIEWYRPARLEQ